MEERMRGPMGKNRRPLTPFDGSERAPEEAGPADASENTPKKIEGTRPMVSSDSKAANQLPRPNLADVVSALPRAGTPSRPRARRSDTNAMGQPVPLLPSHLLVDEPGAFSSRSSWVLFAPHLGSKVLDLESIATAFQTALGENLRLAFDPSEIKRSDSAVFIWIPVSDLKSSDPTLRILADTHPAVPKIAILESMHGDRHFVRKTLRRLGLPVLLTLDDLHPNRVEAALEHARDLARSVTSTQETRERFALALKCAREGFWEWDLQTRQFFLSERGREILGYDANFVATSPEDWLGRIEPSLRQQFRHELASVCSGTEHTPMMRECKIRLNDGAQRWILMNLVTQLDEKNDVTRICAALTDISAYRHRELVLRDRYRRDPSTQLARAEVFCEKLARAVELHKSFPDSTFSVLLIEVHGLATVHASIGVERGSNALHELARRIKAKMRPEDELFRLGTQQLIALLTDDHDETEAMSLAAHVRRTCAEAIEIGDQRVHFRSSIGITSSSRGYASVDDVLADVNAAVSHSKHTGKNFEQRFDLSMRDHARNRMRLEAELREAIKHPEEHFELQYQPILELKPERIIGFESLIRWRHPEQGLIAPARFIPLAEATGLIIDLGRWAILRATNQLARWQSHVELRDLQVNVNLSARQSADPELLYVLEGAVRSTNIRSGTLKIELTESAVLDEPERFRHLAHAIRSLGVPILIDDFGTGFASLSYLQRLPIDGIKIDKTFIDRIGRDKTSTTLVESMVNLGQRLEIDVVAEGVEESEQRDVLIDTQCRYAQGYLFGRPQWPNDALDHALARIRGANQRP
jgi:diguanylate cyclase (GGDEF)-like protein